jgi:hypothetical protein
MLDEPKALQRPSSKEAVMVVRGAEKEPIAASATTT